MASIGFIGLGHMGLPMAKNILKAKHTVHVFDLSPEPLEELTKYGATPADSALHAAEGREIIITMLPEGKHVREIYLGNEGLLQHLKDPHFLIDCSTIDVKTSVEIAEQAESMGHTMVDAPVSGGVKGAEAGTLTFMVGGTKAAFTQAQTILSAMGQTIVHAGQNGHGQAAKICNNFMLAAHMISTCEAFNLAEKLGLNAQTLFDIASKSSGQSWSLTSYCPVPGPVPSAPSNRGYEPGFMAGMMLKDLGLALHAADDVGCAIPLGKKAASLYKEFCDHNGKAKDFSGIIEYLKAL